MGKRRAGIVGLAMLLGLVVALAVLVDLARDYRYRLDDGVVRSRNLARVLEEHTRQSLERVHLSLRAAAVQVRQAGSVDHMDTALLRERVKAQLPPDGLIRAFAVLDGSADLLLTTSDEMARGLRQLPRSRLLQAHRTAQDDQPVLDAPMRNASNEPWLLPVSLRLTGLDGDKDGVLLAIVDTRFFQSFYDAMDVGEHGLLAMVVGRGTTALRSPQRAAAQEDWQHTALLDRPTGAASAGSLRLRDAEGGFERQLSYRRLKDFPVTVVAGWSVDDLLAPWRQHAMVNVGVLLVVWAALAWATRRLSQQLENRRQLESELRQGEARFRSLTKLSSDWFWEQDEQFRFVQFNGESESIGGFARNDHVGKARWEFPALNLGAEDWARHRQTLQRHEPFRDFEIRRPDVAGRPCWMSISGIPVFDDEGRFTGYRGVGRDISERKWAEGQHAQLEQQLREVQKMESIGTLAGGIAHDFNNILGAILGNIALVRALLDDTHPARTHAELIHQAGMRARGLVQQILTFSRKTPQVLQPQAMAPLVEEALALLRATLPAAVELVVRLPDVPLHARADANQLHQVLMNLCTNAWHALNDGQGRIEVGLREVGLDEAEAKRIGTAQAGAHAHLWVRDNGVGMDATRMARIFEPFFTTKPVGQGTGLGLSVVHGIVTAHQGGMTVESAPRRGACFHIYLPLCLAPEPMAHGLPQVEATAVAGHGRRVLCVDDDEVMRLTTETLLMHLGYEVVACASASEAMAVLQQPEHGIDLLLTDYNMPQVSGAQLALAVDAMGLGLPIMITSGYVADELVQMAATRPHWALMNKEDSYSQLGPMLHRLWAQCRSAAAQPAATPELVAA